MVGTVAVIAALLGVSWYGGGVDVLEDFFADSGTTDGSSGGGTGDGDSDDGGGGQSGSGPEQAIGDADPEQARGYLAELTVAEWDSTRGYSRDRFSHWRQEDGCDARQIVLQRDGEDITMDDESCRVVNGSWYSPFDDETLADPGDVDIDHMVPLANAWRTGASEWDDDRRADFANDLDTPQLIAVSASSNRAKGDQDPSQWKPQRSYWCQYAHDWVVVKHYWELWVTPAERDALSDMLDTCD